MKLVAIFLIFSLSPVRVEEISAEQVSKLVKMWSDQIGKELHKLSLTMTRKDKVVQHFKPLKEKVYKEDGAILIQSIASEMRVLMENKVNAVKRIAEYAEFLAYHRDTDYMPPDSPYEFFNAKNITDNSPNKSLELELQDYVREGECNWWCKQNASHPLPYNDYTKEEVAKLFVEKSKQDVLGGECDCNSPPDRTRPQVYFNSLPMVYDKTYDNFVNFNLSVIKIAANIYHRDNEVLQGIQWSEALDLVFKENLAKDPTLKYQYFASPLGYMRHYPAVQWSQEDYDRTYDHRTRSWYTEAMTSPKDIVILLDRSGSMEGWKRQLSAHIINNILDTLNDNDFVNIYTFTNTTEPLVPCFDDTLVQANEENLRLLRESLDVYEIEFAANLTLGVVQAFLMLERFREEQRGSQCNQAIILITEGVDYDYQPQTFDTYNWQSGTAVRIFTFSVDVEENDRRVMEWIACANRGYFANVSLKAEVREKVLNYMNVMSRPVNFNVAKKQEAIWSYLQIDLADRRYSNWLWKKYEGNRQRQVFLDHIKRQYQRLKQVLTSEKYLLLKESHKFEEYQIVHDYNYVTTVSLPVYGRRRDATRSFPNVSRENNDFDLIGVAAVDVPIKLLNSLIPHHKIGVNGYAFILTNNGYILMHPDHRREFENIPKPTFNRVDLLEIEILDDSSEPRLFNESVVKLREKIVMRQKGYEDLKVKFALDDNKRVILSERRYYHTEVGPFSLGIALHHRYGLMVVNNTEIKCEHLDELRRALSETKNWKVHPDWVYCKNGHGKNPQEVVLDCVRKLVMACPRKQPKAPPLMESFLYDANATRGFEKSITHEAYYLNKYLVKNVFVATYSGLTRWRNFKSNDVAEDEEDNFENKYVRTIDEDFYKRAVEENYKDEHKFIYSVPFEISGYENNTMITSTNAIFVRDSKGRFPAAVVGLQFNHRAMYELYNTITNCKVGGAKCEVTCESHYLTCFILDNNAYIVLADEIEYTGRFVGDIRPDIMYHLIKNGVYKPTRMFDYQAICQKLPPEPMKKKKRVAKSSASSYRLYVENLLSMTNWALATIMLLINSVMGGPKYQSLKEDTIAFENLEIKKTYPTPCDYEMTLFTLGDTFSSTVMNSNKTSKFDCPWPYVVDRIPNSNLIFMAINAPCNVDTKNAYRKSPTPTEINYDNEGLPCYIATKNSYSRRIYMNCYNRSAEDDNLNNLNRFYCGHTWDL